MVWTILFFGLGCFFFLLSPGRGQAGNRGAPRWSLEGSAWCCPCRRCLRMSRQAARSPLDPPLPGEEKNNETNKNRFSGELEFKERYRSTQFCAHKFFLNQIVLPRFSAFILLFPVEEAVVVRGEGSERGWAWVRGVGFTTCSIVCKTRCCY